MKIFCINGPNLNLLGTREPHIYGAMTLADIEGEMRGEAARLGHEIGFFQSNHEGDIVDRIQTLKADGVDALVINAGAYTHTSVAIHDALKSFSGTIIELHISNPMARESFRHTSYIAPVATASICGLGWRGYIYAVRALDDLSS